MCEWKTGHLPPTSNEVLNLQCLLYSAMVLENFNEVDRVEVLIYYPRFNYKYEFTVLRGQLVDIKERLLGVILHSLRRNAQLRVGAEQCQYCKAIRICPAVGETTGKAILSDPKELEHLRKFAPLLPVMERYVKVGRQTLKELTRAGVDLGYELKEVQGNREIVKKNEAASRLAAYLTMDEIVDMAEFPITKLEKKFVEKYSKAAQIPKESARRYFNDMLMEDGVMIRGEPSERLVKKGIA